jgi:hypothetical protein
MGGHGLPPKKGCHSLKTQNEPPCSESVPIEAPNRWFGWPGRSRICDRFYFVAAIEAFSPISRRDRRGYKKLNKARRSDPVRDGVGERPSCADQHHAASHAGVGYVFKVV